jgi:hypothetical protein
VTAAAALAPAGGHSATRDVESVLDFVPPLALEWPPSSPWRPRVPESVALTFALPNRPDAFIGLTAWFMGSPNRRSGVRAFHLPPGHVFTASAVFAEAMSYLRRGARRRIPQCAAYASLDERTSHPRVIDVASRPKSVRAVSALPLIAGSLNDHHLVRERSRMDFRAVRYAWPERRWRAVRFRPGVSPRSSPSQPGFPEYRSPAAPRAGRKRPGALRHAWTPLATDEAGETTPGRGGAACPV